MEYKNIKAIAKEIAFPENGCDIREIVQNLIRLYPKITFDLDTEGEFKDEPDAYLLTVVQQYGEQMPEMDNLYFMGILCVIAEAYSQSATGIPTIKESSGLPGVYSITYKIECFYGS
jgi:hypothetical protein